MMLRRLVLEGRVVVASLIVLLSGALAERASAFETPARAAILISCSPRTRTSRCRPLR
ncbi:MAG: hypothetical protein K0R41_4779 [Geminicoccaceae bacterium]|nr:hypothetical protein [Geminicoccaceae bacterium]